MKTRNGSPRLPVIAAAMTLLLVTGVALADPPARVARLAYASGAVSLAPAGNEDWVAAGINRPLVPGDRLWVDQGGRDELQVGSTALRMDGGTLLSVLNLDDRNAQFQLTQGRAQLHVRRLNPGDTVEIDTPNLALSIRKPGVYRLEVDPDGNSTAVAVRSGLAEAYGDGNAYLIDPGQSYRFSGTNLQDYQYAQLPDDDFERWAATRDRRHDNAVARRYVSPELIGYEDLDDNGSWRTVPNYGSVWVPAQVAPGWAPYRDGHWAWVDPWGWTWVDDAPWGFAVSHYGRWTHLDVGWGWVPGPPMVQPVYAPALVAFVAGAALVMERERSPGVAWFPLGPQDVYRPAYRASPRYVTNINVTNTTINRTQITKVVNITNVNNVNYMNRQVPGAVTAVPTQAFVHAQPVRQAAVALNRQVLAKAPVVRQVALAPQRDSRMAGAAPAAHAPALAAARPVLAHNAPPALPKLATLGAAAPQVKVVHPAASGRPLAQPPPPKALAAAPPQPGQERHAAPPPVPPKALVAGAPQPGQERHAVPPPQQQRQEQERRAAVPPQQGPERPPAAASPPRPQPPHIEPARPPQIAALQPRPPRQHIETAPLPQRAPPHAGPPPHPQPPQHVETLPHAPPAHVEASRTPAPPPPRAEPLHPPRAEPPHPPPLPAREPPRQMAMAKPPEPQHRPPPPPPPPETHRAPQAAAQPHPPAAHPPEHHAPPEKDKRKEEHQQ